MSFEKSVRKAFLFYQAKPCFHLTEKIVHESHDILNEIINYTLDTTNKENRFVPHDFKARVNEIYRGLIIGINKRLMKKHEKPNRIITEITITNIKDHHEGRIDALLEYPHGYGIPDWKTYDLSKAISGREKWQLIANILLANYRYRQNEDDWNRYNFLALFTILEPIFLNLAPSRKKWRKLKLTENLLMMFFVVSMYVQRPTFCPVCDKGLEGSKECLFYQLDSRLLLW